MEESVSFVLDYMRLHGPFDGLLGFSQVFLSFQSIPSAYSEQSY